jgi:L-ribulose-5-phosphate 3-epimerase
VNAIAFMTANYVARETGWAMQGWGHGDRATNDAFAPIETYAERLGEILAAVRALGFDAVDVWGGHLGPLWATQEHVLAARDALDRHGLSVATYAAWIGPAELEPACILAKALDTAIIAAGTTVDPAVLEPVLRKRGVTLAIENHPEKTPEEVLEKLAAGDGTLATTVDTGWWATQGYDPVRAIDELAGHIRHVHLKDVVHVGEPHETCRWGDGIVPIEDCVRALRRQGYDGALTIEHEPETYDPSDDCRAMLAQLREWLR